VNVTPTGYWTFFCNPRRWHIDRFLLSGETQDLFAVTEWQKDWFKKGQLGVVRVGRDTRTQEHLGGRAPLEPGVYAIVEVVAEAELRSATHDDYWLEPGELTKPRYRVGLRYVRNLVRNPIPLNHPIFDSSYDKYLVEGFQASTMPLEPTCFRAILEEVGGVGSLDLSLQAMDVKTLEDIEQMDKHYVNASPECKEAYSRRIERGPLAQAFKKVTGFKCQMCERLGQNPYPFKKRNGEYYVESHHIIPVSKLQKGSLASSNLITLCPNHHRQVHYGNVELLELTDNEIVYLVDGTTVRMPKATSLGVSSS